MSDDPHIPIDAPRGSDSRESGKTATRNRPAGAAAPSGFGRRGVASGDGRRHREPVGSSREAGLPRGTARAVADAAGRLEARYNWRIAVMGFSLLSMAAGLYGVASGAVRGVQTSGVGQGAGDEATLLLGASMAGAIGLAWFLCGVLRARALTIDSEGVTGFTLLGRKHIAWPDVARIELAWNPIYKHVLTVHATMGSKTGGYLLTGIPVHIGKMDTTARAVLQAVRTHRPDVPVVETSRRNLLVDIMMKASKFD
jgi:hypothetical protein